jgi:hypothetical protein
LTGGLLRHGLGPFRQLVGEFAGMLAPRVEFGVARVETRLKPLFDRRHADDRGLMGTRRGPGNAVAYRARRARNGVGGAVSGALDGIRCDTGSVRRRGGNSRCKT